MSTYNEPWQAGVLADPNMSAQPYRAPVVGSIDAPAPPTIPSIKKAPIQYPDHFATTYPQQFPLKTRHSEPILAAVDRQNLSFESAQITGTHDAIFPHGNVNSTPNSAFFQGSMVDTGVHPNNDKAGQDTTGNTSRADFKAGQGPTTKLPNGINIGMLQPNEPPPLYTLAPPPQPQVLPGEGTAPLRPTNPAWW